MPKTAISLIGDAEVEDDVREDVDEQVIDQSVERVQLMAARAGRHVLESCRHVDFEIKRVYYLYDVPAGAERGGRAHRELTQLVIAASGGFDVLPDDGDSCKTVRLEAGDSSST